MLDLVSQGFVLNSENKEKPLEYKQAEADNGSRHVLRLARGKSGCWALN